MPALNRGFWTETLVAVHGMTNQPNLSNKDCKEWAMEVLNKVEQHIQQGIPHDSQPDPEDDNKLQQLCRKYEIGVGYGRHPGTEMWILDHIYHDLNDSNLNIIIDLSFNEDVFFLLYRLIER